MQHALSFDDRVLLVACSGGADSLALAAAAVPVARRAQLLLSALVVDHGVQAGSSAVAARARQQLVGLGIGDVAVRQVHVDPEARSGMEAAARTARYGAMEAEAASRQATVLLGHTLDDQAETVLLGLARGSGNRSLAGMAERSGRYLRPLLALRRTVTRQACRELRLAPWQDPHNTDDRYTRSRVRSRVLPLLEAELGPGIAESLHRTALLARDDADLLDELARQAHPASDTLDCDLLAALHRALRRRVIHRWLAGPYGAEVGFVHVVAVEELVTRWHGQDAVSIPGGCVRRTDDRLVCTRGPRVAG